MFSRGQKRKKKAHLQGRADKTTEKSHPFIVVLLTIGVFKAEKKAKGGPTPDMCCCFLMVQKQKSTVLLREKV